jgi:hypothetical protein
MEYKHRIHSSTGYGNEVINVEGMEIYTEGSNIHCYKVEDDKSIKFYDIEGYLSDVINKG